MTEKLFETALAISAPWFVTGTDLNARVRTLTIRVDFAPGSRFAAPGAAGGR
jgi:transposase